jgi:peptidoglycan-associated lipoprotein
MRWKILVILLCGLGIAACETTPADTGSGTVATGGTTDTTGGSSSQVPATRGSIASRPLATGPRPGSQEDLVTNVGDRIFFDFDSIQLRVDARATLERQSEWLKQNSAVDVWIEGHADERGTREYNLALGERRANAIRDYLVALGIADSRLKTRSYGKERPVDPRSTPEAWTKNRRGVVVIQ